MFFVEAVAEALKINPLFTPRRLTPQEAAQSYAISLLGLKVVSEAIKMQMGREKQ